MPVRRKAIRRSLNADPFKRSIVAAAVARGRVVGWDRVRFSDVARELKVSVSEILRAYRDLDAVADAWFARATSAMADAGTRAAGRAPKARLETAMLAWFDALASERRVTAQMLRTKLYPAHPHHWVPMVFSLSRTIQLLRDVAGLGADVQQLTKAVGALSLLGDYVKRVDELAVELRALRRRQDDYEHRIALEVLPRLPKTGTG